jgi:hypothetical protein
MLRKGSIQSALKCITKRWQAKRGRTDRELFQRIENICHPFRVFWLLFSVPVKHRASIEEPIQS